MVSKSNSPTNEQDRGDKQRAKEWIGLAGLALAVIGAVIGALALPFKRFLILCIILLAIAPWLTMMTRVRQWKYWRFVYPVVISASIVADGSAYLVHNSSGHPTRPATQTLPPPKITLKVPRASGGNLLNVKCPQTFSG